MVLSDDTPACEQLRKVFRHRSPNDFQFEWRSIKRWIIFRDYCLQHDLKQFFTMDSDVLLFCNVDKQAGFWGESEMSLFNPHPGAMSVGSVFFHTLRPLEMFCGWLQCVYEGHDQGAYDFLYANHPNITDMALWNVFLMRHPEISHNFLDHPRNNKAFDSNLCVFDGGWENDGTSKVIHFKQGYPWARCNGSKVRLNCIHCWGKWKHRIDELYQQAIASVEKGAVHSA